MKFAKQGVMGKMKNKSIGSARLGRGGKKGGMGMGKAGPLVTTPAKDGLLMKRG